MTTNREIVFGESMRHGKTGFTGYISDIVGGNIFELLLIKSLKFEKQYNLIYNIKFLGNGAYIIINDANPLVLNCKIGLGVINP